MRIWLLLTQLWVLAVCNLHHGAGAASMREGFTVRARVTARVYRLEFDGTVALQRLAVLKLPITAHDILPAIPAIFTYFVLSGAVALPPAILAPASPFAEEAAARVWQIFSRL